MATAKKAGNLTAKQKRFYVYMLVDPRTSSPFYAGKGCGNRASRHESLARLYVVDNAPKYAVIRSIIDSGLSVSIEMVAQDLTEQEAFSIERGKIAELQGLTNISLGVCTNEEKSKIEAQCMLSRMKTCDQWIDGLSSERRDQVFRVFGAPREFYEKFVVALREVAVA